MAMKVISWNVNGLNNPIKRKRIARTLNKLKAHIILLQETHLKSQDDPVLKLPHFSQQYAAAGSSKARVAVLISDALLFQCSEVMRDPGGRFIFVKGVLEGQPCTISSIYAPNSDQLHFLEKVFVQLVEFQEGHQIVCVCGGGLELHSA